MSEVSLIIAALVSLSVFDYSTMLSSIYLYWYFIISQTKYNKMTKIIIKCILKPWFYFCHHKGILYPGPALLDTCCTFPHLVTADINVTILEVLWVADLARHCSSPTWWGGRLNNWLATLWCDESGMEWEKASLLGHSFFGSALVTGQ